MPRPLFEADLLEPGSHLSRTGGTLHATPARLQRYVDQFRRMKAAGIKVPLYWGHQMTAERFGPDRQPHPDDRATEKARWKAGHVKDLRLNPETGRLRITATCPPGCSIDPHTRELIDPERHTCIDEVSAGIGDWQDGARRWWDDAVVHVALTPLPAWVWQDGFSPAADGTYALGDGRTRLRFVLGGNMADPKKPEDDEDDTLPGADAGDAAPEGDAPPEEGAGDEMPPADPEAAPMPAEGEQDAAGDDPMAEAEAPTEGDPEAPELGDMPDPDADPEAMEPDESPVVQAAAAIGINVPEGTTSENIESVMVGIFAGLAASGARITVGGEHEIQPSGQQPTTEAPPMFMLSAGEPTPSGMSEREWVLARREGEHGQADRRARIESLRGRGVKAEVCDRLRESATRFSLSADGVASFPDVDGHLALLEDVVGDFEAKTQQAEGVLTAALSTADPKCKDPANPARGGDVDPADPEYRTWRDQQAERMYGAGAKAADPKVLNA